MRVENLIKVTRFQWIYRYVIDEVAVRKTISLELSERIDKYI